jgi:hypothetical protein
MGRREADGCRLEEGADRMSNETRLLVIVRRGATERFDLLNTRLAGEPVQISWDRRIADRRQRKQRVRLERRHGDRRGSPPLTWPAGGFVITRQPAESVHASG